MEERGEQQRGNNVIYTPPINKGELRTSSSRRPLLPPGGSADYKSDISLNSTLGVPSASLHLLKYATLGHINTEDRPEDLQLAQSFPQFSKLSAELRLIVWTNTWPAPRMIEAAICEDKTVHNEYEDVAILRFAGPLSTLLHDKNFGSRVVEQNPLVHCRPPVSLYICQESRIHTLSQYRRIEHTAAKQGSFYFNPYRDVMWLSIDFTDEPNYLRDLKRCYGTQLNAIGNLLVEESDWTECTPAGYYSWYLEPFGGLKSILLLSRDSIWDTDESDGEDGGQGIENHIDGEDGYDSTEDAKDADGNDVVEVEGFDSSEGGDESSDQESELVVRKRHLRANRLRTEYAEFSKHRHGPTASFQCIDRSGTFY
jgi:hypothetical protein